MERIRAVLFDFDGTLADSYDAIAASINHVRQTQGLGALSVDEVKRHVGRGPAYLVEHTVPGCEVAEAVARYRAHHPAVMFALTRFLPQARETLQILHDRGLRLGVCSNKPRAFTLKLLEHLQVAELFDIVLGPEDVPHLKPAPDMLQAALRFLTLAPHEVLYVGDMVVDIQTARAAGVSVWAIASGSDDRDVLEAAKPDRLIESLREIADAL